MSKSLTGRRRLYLMRHGHVDYFAPGLTDFTQVSLTAEGQEQAKAAGEALRNIAFDHIFTSGLPRTQQTAAAVMAANSKDYNAPITIPSFEELKGGKVVVETREELAARLAFSFDAATEPGATFLPDGEAFETAYERITKGLLEIVEDFAWKQALLVAHDGVNRILLGAACGAGLGGIAHFEQDLACINVLDLDVVRNEENELSFARIIIKAVNLTAYDPVKHSLSKTSLEHLFDIDFGGGRPL
ncbi:MAG: histidine phosphatase family protein [Pseudomonadota bacterium]